MTRRSMRRWRRARRTSSASSCRAARSGSSGLGAIGVEVANSALALGMKVLGYDPQITVQRAWQLSSSVEQALSLDDLFARADAISVHVPLNDATRGLVNAARLKLMKPGGTHPELRARRRSSTRRRCWRRSTRGRLHAYVCDFPNDALKDHPQVVTLPHLGASTGEAEENCAVMVAEQLRDFLENGNIRNSVNFPEAVLPRVPNTTRLAIANSNVPNMVGQISTCLAGAQLNIADLLNKSRGEYAYTLIDADGAVARGGAGADRAPSRACCRRASSEDAARSLQAQEEQARSAHRRPGRRRSSATWRRCARASTRSMSRSTRCINERARLAQQVGISKAPAGARSTSTARSARRRCCARRASATTDRCATRRCCGCSARSCRRAWRSRSR